MAADIEAVIFDWGGTLTPWHTIDFDEEARVLARAVVGATDAEVAAATALRAATEAVWGRSRDHHTSATRRRHLRGGRAGRTTRRCSTAYREFWDAAHAHRPRRRCRCSAGCGSTGCRVGILSNTVWPREWHEEFFRRDGVLDLIDGAVYTSEIPWTKPSPEAFRAAVEAVGVDDPARCVFVGDRLFDDIWGAANARHAHHPRAAQRHPARAGGPHRGRAGRGGRPARATCTTWCPPGARPSGLSSSATPGNRSGLRAERQLAHRGVEQRVDGPLPVAARGAADRVGVDAGAPLLDDPRGRLELRRGRGAGSAARSWSAPRPGRRAASRDHRGELVAPAPVHGVRRPQPVARGRGCSDDETRPPSTPYT